MTAHKHACGDKGCPQFICRNEPTMTDAKTDYGQEFYDLANIVLRPLKNAKPYMADFSRDERIRAEARREAFEEALSAVKKFRYERRSAAYTDAALECLAKAAQSTPVTQAKEKPKASCHSCSFRGDEICALCGGCAEHCPSYPDGCKRTP